MPALMMHQVRVAGVAAYISDHIQGVSIDHDDIVTACLLHDMGNILKFDLHRFPAFLEPKGFVYWQQVQDDYRRMYGNDEHEATVKIVKEVMRSLSNLSVLSGDEGQTLQKLKDTREEKNRSLSIRPARVMDLIDSIGFSKAKVNALCHDYSVKIAAYADMRVTPNGVATLPQRLHDGYERFRLRKPHDVYPGHFEEMSHYLSQIEKQIFNHLPEDKRMITDKEIESYIKSLADVNFLLLF